MWNRPVAATVIGMKEVEKLNILTMKGVSEITPNFYMPAYGSRMTSSIYVRGLGARIDQPVVGLNIDNVPILNKDNYDFDLIDIKNIEVLRGPQSTLFGRNTMGGQINITTLSPLNFQGLRLLAEYGRNNSIKGAVSYYDMLSSRFGIGLSAYYTTTDGFFRNDYSGKKTDKEHQAAFRFKSSWLPSETVSVENTLGVTLSRQGGYPYASLETGLISHNDTCFYRRNGVTDGLSVTWRGKDFSVASVSSFQYIDDNMTLDQDFLPLDYFTLTQKRHEWAFTEDIVAKGRKNNYSWLGGIFGFWRNTRMWAPVTFKADGIERLILHHRNEMMPDYPARWDDDSFVLHSDFKMPTRGVAIYHTSTLDLGRWEITAGLRLDYEKVTLDYFNKTSTSYTIYHIQPDGSESVFDKRPVDIAYNGKLSRDFTQFIPKLSMEYSLDESEKSIIYASISKGYKAGGFNTQMFSDFLQQRLMNEMGISATYDIADIIAYKPEVSMNYELGCHLDFPELRLKLEGAAFFIDCRDQQLTMFPSGSTTGRVMTNAGRTHSYGVELSGDYSPTENLNFKASWGYTHATFSKFNNGINDYKGKRLPYAPSNTLFILGAYTLPLNTNAGDGISFCVNMRGVGDIYWDEANLVKQPFYAQLGASVEWMRRDFSLSLWGENLTNTRFDTFYFVSIGNAFVQRGNPWSVGATLRYTLRY